MSKTRVILELNDKQLEQLRMIADKKYRGSKNPQVLRWMIEDECRLMEKREKEKLELESKYGEVPRNEVV